MSTETLSTDRRFKIDRLLKGSVEVSMFNKELAKIIGRYGYGGNVNEVEETPEWALHQGKEIISETHSVWENFWMAKKR